MKKILIIAHVQSHIINFHIPIIELFLSKNYEVYVATKLDYDRYKYYIDDKLKEVKWIDIEFSRNPLSFNTIISFKQLINIMSQIKFDLIHVNTPIAAFIGRLSAKVTKSVAPIYTAHGFHFHKNASSLNWLIYYPIEKLASRWSSAIITINNEDYLLAKSKFKNISKEHIYKVNGVGVDSSRYRIHDNLDIKYKRNIGLEEDDFIITMIGEINKNKNQMQLVKSAIPVINKYKNIKILLVGEGESRQEIEKYLKDNNIDKNIIFLGFRFDIPEILNISDIVISMSRREGLPKNIIEAMMAGKAIIATNIRGNNELVKDGVNGIIVEYGDYYKTTLAIENLYEDRKLLNLMGNKSRILSDKYSTDNILKDMEKIYNNYLK